MRKIAISCRNRPAVRAIGGIAIAALCWSQAYADDPRCKAPPYGMSDRDFRAFVETFGQFVVPTKTLPALCNAKYSGADRTGLYNLGFTDRDIDSKNLGDIALQFMDAMHNLASKIR
jgi:hypothetical protein